MLSPNLSAQELFELASSQPELWEQILAHPNCYPDLANWIRQQPAFAPMPPATAQPLSPATAQPIPPATAKPRKSKGLIWTLVILLVLLVAALVVLGIWFGPKLLGKDGAKEGSESNSTTSSAPAPTTKKAPVPDAKKDSQPAKPQLHEDIRGFDFGNYTADQYSPEGYPEWEMRNNSNLYLEQRFGDVVYYPNDTKYVDLNGDKYEDAVLYMSVCSGGANHDEACYPHVRVAVWDPNQKAPHFIPGGLLKLTKEGHYGADAATAREEALDRVKVEDGKLLVQTYNLEPYKGSNYHPVIVVDNAFLLAENNAPLPQM